MGRKMPLVVLLLDDITDKLRYAQAVWLILMLLTPTKLQICGVIIHKY